MTSRCLALVMGLICQLQIQCPGRRSSQSPFPCLSLTVILQNTSPSSPGAPPSPGWLQMELNTNLLKTLYEFCFVLIFANFKKSNCVVPRDEICRWQHAFANVKRLDVPSPRGGWVPGVHVYHPRTLGKQSFLWIPR